MSFEDDVATAKASGRPFYIRWGDRTREVVYLTAAEISKAAADKAAEDARQAAKAAERAALFSAARVLDPLPSPYNQSELNAKVEGLLELIRRLHPELVR